MMLYGWLHNTYSQSQAGLEQYYYVHDNAVSIAPVAWYQANNNWYTECRYNYEAEKTLSVYAGKTFEIKSAVYWSFCPMAGLVTGRFNGGAIAVNTTLEYKKLYCSLQSQYTFSIENSRADYIYNWFDLGFRPAQWLTAGMSIQQTSLCNSKSEKGVFIKATYGVWELPIYIFNPGTGEYYWVFGLNFIWQHKRKINSVKPVKYPTLNNNPAHL